jgi:hypothetical protein
LCHQIPAGFIHYSTSLYVRGGHRPYDELFCSFDWLSSRPRSHDNMSYEMMCLQLFPPGLEVWVILGLFKTQEMQMTQLKSRS